MASFVNKMLGIYTDKDVNTPDWKPLMMEKMGMKAVGKLGEEIGDHVSPEHQNQINRGIEQGENAANNQFKRAYSVPVDMTETIRPTAPLAPFIFLHRSCLPDPMTPTSMSIIQRQVAALVPILDDEKRHGKERSKGSLSRGVRCLTFDTSARDKLADVTLTTENLSEHWPKIESRLGSTQPSKSGALRRGHIKIKKLYLAEYTPIRPIMRPACISIIFTTGNVVDPSEMKQFIDFVEKRWANLYIIIGLVQANQFVKDEMRRAAWGNPQVKLVHLEEQTEADEMAKVVRNVANITTTPTLTAAPTSMTTELRVQSPSTSATIGAPTPVPSAAPLA